VTEPPRLAELVGSLSLATDLGRRFRAGNRAAHELRRRGAGTRGGVPRRSAARRVLHGTPPLHRVHGVRARALPDIVSGASAALGGHGALFLGSSCRFERCSSNVLDPRPTVGMLQADLKWSKRSLRPVTNGGGARPRARRRESSPAPREPSPVPPEPSPGPREPSPRPREPPLPLLP
jgi:hypothetical protein